MKSILLLLFLYAVSSHANSTKPPFKIAINEFPPWVVIDKNGTPSGIDIIASKKIAELLNYQPKFISCPFARCLKMGETGDVDAIVNLFYSPERSQYLTYIDHHLFIDPAKVLYFLEGSTVSDIKTIADLEQHTVGQVRGAIHFNDFDHNDNIRRVFALNTKQLVDMFLKKRFEVLIGAEATIDFYLKQHHSTDKIRKATLKHATNMKSYFAISKKSPFNEHISAISNALKQLNEQGVFQNLQQSALLKAKSDSPQ